MNNIELELKLKEILENKNMFDLIENAVAFDKEYKQSSFYKNTKLPLMEVVKYGKVFYGLDVKELVSSLKDSLQNIINDLDYLETYLPMKTMRFILN